MQELEYEILTGIQLNVAGQDKVCDGSILCNVSGHIYVEREIMVATVRTELHRVSLAICSGLGEGVGQLWDITN